MANTERYELHVEELERGLADYAFTTKKATQFINGEDVLKHYEDQWQREDGRVRLKHRTPLMIERDRILYSDELRRLTDKYHILFQGSDRILRNYTTQTLRTAHVARTIARALQLNTDFAEAIALGAKVGAVPFVHIAKSATDTWVRESVKAIDKAQERRDSRGDTKQVQRQLFPTTPDVDLPAWVAELASPQVIERVARYVPWAAGEPSNEAYSSGKESYWFLSTDPYLRRPKPRSYLPQTMYGIWRHSRGLLAAPNTFVHSSPLWADHTTYTGLRWEHATYEAYVVQYADDITWAIENVNDANAAATLSGRPDAVYQDLASYLARNSAPDTLLNRVNGHDPGGMYTYFINDLVETSQGHLRDGGAVGPVVNLPD